jgi:hypothetical protein
VLSGSTQVLAINCGLLLNGGISVSPTTFTNQGTLLAANGDSLSASNLQPNAGTITANAGSQVKINGAYTQTSAGVLNIQIAGTSISQYGVLNITGAATLAGTLNVSLANGFVPAVGNSFPVITYASHTGTFDIINGLNLPNNETFTPSYNVASFTLTAG